MKEDNIDKEDIFMKAKINNEKRIKFLREKKLIYCNKCI